MIFPLLTVLIMLVVYVHNLSRSVYGGDVGDLVTAAYVGGVPHAPGYPLFTFLGYLLSHIFFFFSPAFSIGLISVLSGAGALLFFYLTIRKLLKRDLISLVATFVMGTSFLFWFYNEIAEVFALNNFFGMLLLYLSVTLYQKFQKKIFFLFCFVAGLACTNHQTIVLLLPGFLLLIAAQMWKTQKKKWKILFQECLVGLLCFLLGFIPYLYVVVANMHNAPINWDPVKDIPSFFHLILRQDYGTFKGGIFTQPSFLQRFIIVKTYLLTLLFQLTIPVVGVSLIGILAAWKKSKILATAIFIDVILCGPFFVMYVGFPLNGSFYIGLFERFFILSSIIFLFFFPFGLDWLSVNTSKFLKRDMWKYALPLLFLLVPLQLFIYNFPKTNLSQVIIGDTFGRDLLTPLPDQAALFLGGDTTLFNAWYVHYALHIRPDMNILNLNGLARDAYFDNLKAAYKKQHPTQDTVNLSQNVLQDLNMKRPVFAIDPVQPSTESAKKFTWLPYGLSYKLLKDNESIPTDDEYKKTLQVIWGKMHIPFASAMESKANGNLTIADLPEAYANAMLATGNFFLTDYKDTKEAKWWYDKALLVSPHYPKIHSVLGVWYLTISHECSNASDQLQQAIILDPTDRLPYYLLYTTYTSCLHDDKKAKEVADIYTRDFRFDFKKAYNEYMKGKK